VNLKERIVNLNSILFMRLVCCVCALLAGMAASGQRPKTYTVPAGVEVREIVPTKEIFQYPNFIQGVVVFRDGTSAPGKLNYNMLVAELQFIDPKGDTLSLANEATILIALIGKDTFYYSQGYVRQLASGQHLKIGERVAFKEFINKPGAYGLSSATTATNNVSDLLNRRSQQLNVSQEIVLVKNTNYLLGDKFNWFVIADKHTVLRFLPDKRPEIEEFIQKNKTNFNNGEDLVKLAKFMNAF
jgi:hypothetical protein